MITSFTAIDFETAHYEGNSICQIGLVTVEFGKIKEKVSLFVQPPGNYYLPRFTQIHGIDALKTKDAPTFDKAWAQVLPYIQNQNVVAHNGFSFDFPVLKRTLAFYDLALPQFNKYCTYKIYGKGLSKLCLEHSIELNHHEALSDALACAKLFQMHIDLKK